MNFQVGKEVVCVKSHSTGFYKEGDTFICKGLKQSDCCGHLLINIGTHSQHTHIQCLRCGSVKPHDNYYAASSFVPLDDISISEVTEVLEKEPFEA